jgi:hypothetical protein
VNVLDAAFIDDECLVLVSASAKSLRKSIDILLESLVTIFSFLRLEINWNPGKTEAFLTFRGKNAVKIRESLRTDGKVMIPVPGTDKSLSIVGQYKHLGSMMSSDRSDVPYARARASSAMCSYVPLAMKIFGSDCVGLPLRLTFMSSLVMSKLCFNAHVKCLSPQALKHLNGVYMRVVRRIAGEVYMDGSSKTDFDVRKLLGVPSIDCHIQRA